MNRVSCWQLPGPGRFVTRVADDLRDGRNVVLSLPEHLAEGLAPAIRADLGESWTWSMISLNEGACEAPVPFIYNRFGIEAEPAAIRNPGTLAVEECIGGRIIWVQGLSVGSWPQWKHFIYEYQHACRSRATVTTGRFLLDIDGIARTRSPDGTLVWQFIDGAG